MDVWGGNMCVAWLLQAINIGHSCNILSSDTYNAIIDGKDLPELNKQVAAAPKHSTHA